MCISLFKPRKETDARIGEAKKKIKIKSSLPEPSCVERKASLRLSLLAAAGSGVGAGENRNVQL